MGLTDKAANEARRIAEKKILINTLASIGKGKRPPEQPDRVNVDANEVRFQIETIEDGAKGCYCVTIAKSRDFLASPAAEDALKRRDDDVIGLENFEWVLGVGDVIVAKFEPPYQRMAFRRLIKSGESIEKPSSMEQFDA